MKNRVLYMLILVVLVALYILPSYAETTEQTGADLLMKYKFITGSHGDAMISKPLTRAEVAVIMAEMNGVKSEASNFAVPPAFSDVSPDKWYAPYIAYGKTNGYLGGYPDGTFNPDSAVTAQEFAAFLMNAMGYNGYYTYDNVIQFASLKKVYIETKGASFVRGDAFEAMWDAVNQPAKGSEIAIGTVLGKLELNPVGNTTKLGFEIKVASAKSFEVKFDEVVTDTERVTFGIKHQTINYPLNVTWSPTKNMATLSSNLILTTGTYEITVTDATHTAPYAYEPQTILVEAEKVVKVTFDSDLLTRFDDYFGTASYKAYNQYDEDVTSTSLGRRLVFSSSTSVSTPVVDFNSGLVTIQQGSPLATSGTLSELPFVTVVITDPISGFGMSKLLKIGTSNNAISEVHLYGIINEMGEQVNFVYQPNMVYYLDVNVLDSGGKLIKSYNVLNSNISGQETISVRSSNEALLTVTKVPHPFRTAEIAYRIDFVTPPFFDTPVQFTVIAPYATTNNTATYSSTLKLKY